MSIVILLSGGMDSTTLLAEAVATKGGNVHAISFAYGQRHDREILAAENVAEYYKVPHQIVNVLGLGDILRGSALTEPEIEVPEGHYADESMKATVVPNRNAIFLTIAGGYAISNGLHAVGYAAHTGDHAIYPDCRQSFVREMRSLLRVSHYTPIELFTPYLHKSKAEIVQIGRKLNVPYHHTWSCYKGELLHCGKCGTCVERLEAFNLAGVKDPVDYA